MPPLCGLEVTGTRVEGQSLVVECQLSLNLNSLTLEAVVSKRRAIVADMCTNMQLELRQELRQKDAVRRVSTSVAGRGSLTGAEQDASKGWPDLRELCGDFDVDALATSMLDEQLVSIRSQDVEHYNDDKMLSRAVQAAVHAKAAVNGWPSIMEEVLAAALLDEVSDDENEGDEDEGDDDGSDGDDDDDEDDAECYKLHLWDIGGQSTIRAYWRNYYEKTDGIIWVIDACDTVRLPLVQHELANVLQQERLAGASLLLLANKSDVTNAWTPAALADGLHLDTEVFRGQTHTRHWKLQGCSAVTTQGLLAGLDWLVQDITDRIFYTG